MIQPEWEDELYKYITGIVQNHKHKTIAINGMPDHIHIFIGFHTTQSIAELMKVVKGDSAEWINGRRFVKGRFRWQEGYGAFTYSRSHIDRVYHYVLNQKDHHAREAFLKEYRKMLEEHGVDYDERFIFHPPVE